MTLAPADWYAVRRAQSGKPSTYRCPFCQQHFPAMTEHVLVTPEADASRRRHAHTTCALRARRDGRLPSLEEWRAQQPRQPSLLRRIAHRVGRRATLPER